MSVAACDLIYFLLTMEGNGHYYLRIWCFEFEVIELLAPPPPSPFPSLLSPPLPPLLPSPTHLKCVHVDTSSIVLHALGGS